MKIVVTSDSHGRVEILKRIAASEKADLYLDAGDSEREERELPPFLSVRGNRDHLITNRYRIVTAGGMRIFLFTGTAVPSTGIIWRGLRRIMIARSSFTGTRTCPGMRCMTGSTSSAPVPSLSPGL